MDKWFKKLMSSPGGKGLNIIPLKASKEGKSLTMEEKSNLLDIKRKLVELDQCPCR
jgi:hypothetical protein